MRTHLIVGDLKQDQLAAAKRIKEPQRHRSNHGTEEAEDCDVTMLRVHMQYSNRHLLHITFAGKKYETSSKLNKTPPMGAPKATATPAAHAALRISLRLPRSRG